MVLGLSPISVDVAIPNATININPQISPGVFLFPLTVCDARPCESRNAIPPTHVIHKIGQFLSTGKECQLNSESKFLTHLDYLAQISLVSRVICFFPKTIAHCGDRGLQSAAFTRRDNEAYQHPAISCSMISVVE